MDENPTYPKRNGDYSQYHSGYGSGEGQVSANGGPGTYYVRVCSYGYEETDVQGSGECQVYSNQIVMELE